MESEDEEDELWRKQFDEIEQFSLEHLNLLDNDNDCVNPILLSVQFRQLLNNSNCLNESIESKNKNDLTYMDCLLFDEERRRRDKERNARSLGVNVLPSTTALCNDNNDISNDTKKVISQISSYDTSPSDSEEFDFVSLEEMKKNELENADSAIGSDIGSEETCTSSSTASSKRLTSWKSIKRKKDEESSKLNDFEASFNSTIPLFHVSNRKKSSLDEFLLSPVSYHSASKAWVQKIRDLRRKLSTTETATPACRKELPTMKRVWFALPGIEIKSNNTYNATPKSILRRTQPSSKSSLLTCVNFKDLVETKTLSRNTSPSPSDDCDIPTPVLSEDEDSSSSVAERIVDL